MVISLLPSEIVPSDQGCVRKAMRNYRCPQKLYEIYWVKGKRVREVAESEEVAVSTIYRWIKKYNIPKRRKSEEVSRALKGVERKSARIKPDLSPSKEICYVLGVALGDGHVDSKKGRFCFKQSVERMPFVESVMEALKKIGLNPGKRLLKLKNSAHADQIVIEAGSREFAEWFQKLSLEDIKRLVTRSEGNTTEFIRGFYESEGCNRDGEKIFITNTNLALLQLVVGLLKGLGFKTGFEQRKGKEGRRDVYRIYVRGGWRKRRKFIEKIKPCVKNFVPECKRLTLSQADKAGEKWSERDIDSLKKHWYNKSAPKIAKELGRSKISVYKKVSRLGLKLSVKERLTKEGEKSLSKEAAEVLLSKEKLASMYKSMAIAEIASQLKVTGGTVHNWMKRHHIPRRNHRRAKDLLLVTAPEF